MKKIFIKITLLVTLYVCLPSKTYSQYANVQDSLALVNLYNSTNGPAWVNRGGWLTGLVSSWYGVTINANGRVTSLVLQFNRLAGNLPNLNLPYLQTLNLSLNQLTGTFPNLVLPDLQTLLINNNRFSGDFPNLVLNNLVTLNCNINLLTGMAPLNLPALQTLSAAGNQITGAIPGFVLPALQTLSLNSNQFSGPVPSFSMPLLKTLNLSVNKLTSVPALNLPALLTMDISKNLLAGNIPAFNLASLTVLNLSENQLSGSIPAFNLPALITLSLNNNQLTGPIPLFNFPALVTLNLHNNQLSGAIPALSLPSVVTLNLYNNQLSSISFLTMPALVSLYAYNNQLSGTIPDFNLPSLKTLQLNYNLLSGAAPGFNQTALTTLDLSHNLLTNIDLISRQSLYRLDVSYNQLSSLSQVINLPAVWWMNLSHNLVTGTVPDFFLMPNLQSLLLSYNKFDQVPNFNYLPALSELRLSNNLLTGNVPVFTHTPFLSAISLDTNQLSGPLPVFNPLPYELSLSHNNLSGTVPPEYGPNGFSFLDISHNQLTGHFPATQIFSEMYYFINDNLFTFDGLEELVPQFNATNGIVYAPQGKIKLHQVDSVLSVTASPTPVHCTYIWSKEDQEIATIIGDSTFVITTPGRYSVKVKNTLVPSLILYSDTLSAVKILLVDPVYSAVLPGGNINPDLSQLNISKTVAGASTDGLTKIILYTSSTIPITFQVLGANNGSLNNLAGNQPVGAQVTVDPDINGKVGAVYMAPDGIGSVTAGIAEREIVINATVGTNVIALHLKLVTPPIVLVHGMWSSPGIWDKSFKKSLFLQGFRHMAAADYHADSYRTFDPSSGESNAGKNAVRTSIANELYLYRNVLNIAASQVDVVAHSLGGLMTRSLAQEDGFKNQQNYYKGDIHKLITLATPHRGSPFGPELYKVKDDIYNLNLIGIPLTVSRPSKLALLLNVAGMSIGSCHKDFAISSVGLSNIGPTLPFKTFAITADHAGQTVGESAMEAMCLTIFYKTHAAVMASRCAPVPTLTNDLIVPLNSQKGFHENGKFELFNNVGHSIPALNTETSDVMIQIKVGGLLTSNDATEFASGFPASFDIPLDCNSATERPNASMVTGHLQRVVPDKAIHITSPANGTIVQDGSGANLALTFETIGNVNPASALFMVENVGWFPVPATPPYTVNIALPSYPLVGNLKILALASDSSGTRFADTTSIIVSPSGVLDSMSVEPARVELDSTVRQASLYVNGFYKNGTIVRMADITDPSAGTLYTADHSNIISVSTGGLVKAISAGTDTITISNAGHFLRLPVIVNSNFTGITYADNTIDFPLIDDKAVTDDPFSLLATASSGDEVSYEVLSGPAIVNAGIVTLSGQPGTVTVKATAQGNSYFNSALPVIRTFQVLNVQTYTFIGNGNWNDPANWLNNVIPPPHIQNGAFIYIDPAVSGECVLNVQQIIDSPGKLVIKAGKKLKITGDLIVNP